MLGEFSGTDNHPARRRVTGIPVIYLTAGNLCADNQASDAPGMRPLVGPRCDFQGRYGSSIVK
jgi:hypothetical protein